MQIKTFSLLAALACAPAFPVAAQIGVGISIGVPPPGAVIVNETPPPPQAEIIAPAPGPGYVWITGHWVYEGRGRRHWRWVGGQWMVRPSPGAVWIPGHWMATQTGGTFWVEGQWTVQPPPPVAVAPGAPMPPGEVIVQEAPPPVIQEGIPASPGPDFFWIGGRWDWRGGWVWLPGRYERHPHYHPGARWEAGRWDHRPNGYVWIEGAWR